MFLRGGDSVVWPLCGLTFELRGRQRQGARPGPVKMYSVPPTRAWWPAVGAPLERGVRPQFAALKTRNYGFGTHGLYSMDLMTRWAE